jgi:hypothetical protein
MKSPKPLTQMTMDESLAWGEQFKSAQGMNSSAKGAFQIVNSTQREAMTALGMKGSDMFNEENQKKMASWIAHKQGLGAWEGFKSHPEQLRVAQQALQSGADKDFSSSRPLTQNNVMPQDSFSHSGGHGGGHGIISGALEGSGAKGSIIATAENFLGKSESNAKEELQKFIGQFHHPIDIHDPVSNKNSSGFLPEERAWLTQFTDNGFIDSFRFFNKDPHHYSWWSYRAGSRARNKGWRIDYCMIHESIKHKLKSAGIMSDAVHSDHCPVFIEIK